MMKTIVKDTLALVAITLVAAICLSFVHELTAETIAAAEAEERQASYREVFPDAAEFTAIENLENLTAAANLSAGVSIGEALTARDSNGDMLGYVVSVTSANGYGGDIVLSVGFDEWGVITGMKVTSMSETSGLGSHCTDKEFSNQFIGISDKVVYTKNGKSAPNEIDMISGATFTTSAVTEAVNGARSLVNVMGVRDDEDDA